MLEILSERYKTFKLESWRDFDDFDAHDLRCLYRGHGCESWVLRTAYERCQRVQNPMREQRMLHRFMAEAGIYESQLPDQDDYISWLSLMQHYGVGTRLLDVTRSKYIALFFALIGMYENKLKEDGAVWVFKTFASDLTLCNALMTSEDDPCIDPQEMPSIEALSPYKALGSRFAKEFIITDWLGRVRETCDDKLVCQHKVQMSSFVESGGVLHVVPDISNKRMVNQAAEFLMPITLRRSFDDNLFDGAKDNKGIMCAPEVVKLVVPKNLFGAFMSKLRDMNITHQTVYPDISGLAMSVNV